MRGLLIKDFTLMKMQKNFFIVVIVMAIAMSVSMQQVSFVAGYLSFVMPLFALSTISYDEFDNGNVFLFTLPISRKGYVMEKYCFSFLLGLVSFVLAVALSFGLGIAMDVSEISNVLKAMPFIFSVMLVMLAIFIPLQIKFGAEKSRVAMIIVGGAACLVGYGIVKLLEILKFDVAVLENMLRNVNLAVFMGVALGIAFVVLALSMKISIAIMCRKEF